MGEDDDCFQQILLPELEQLLLSLKTCLKESNPAVDRLLQLNERHDRIADFGCGDGSRTVALIIRLGATEAIGIDIDAGNIAQALQCQVSGTLQPIRQEAQRLQQVLAAGPRLSQRIRAQAEFLVATYINVPLPEFRQGDITRGRDGTNLPSDWYDLVYCRYLLYHLYCDDTTRGQAMSAVEEMARVARPGALVVAYEPATCSSSDATQVALASLFDEQGNLESVERIDLEYDTIYIYAKTGRYV